MSQYNLHVPQFIDDDVKEIYAQLCNYGYGRRTGEEFLDDLEKKQEQIEKYPLSCAVDTAYPSLTEMGVRKAVIFDGRYLLLYMIENQDVIVIMVERAERDYIIKFEANHRLYESEKQRDD